MATRGMARGKRRPVRANGAHLTDLLGGERALNVLLVGKNQQRGAGQSLYTSARGAVIVGQRVYARSRARAQGQRARTSCCSSDCSSALQSRRRMRSAESMTQMRPSVCSK